jgi:DNA gyrase subunit A
MVQRTSVKGISRYGRASQGVRLMNLRDDDVVSAVAVVVEDSADTAAVVAEELPAVDAGETTTQPPELEVPTAESEAPPEGAEAASAEGSDAAAEAPDEGTEDDSE